MKLLCFFNNKNRFFQKKQENEIKKQKNISGLVFFWKKTGFSQRW